MGIKSLSLSPQQQSKRQWWCLKKQQVEKKQKKKQNEIIKKLYGPFLWLGFNYLKARAVYFITLRSQKFLELYFSTSEKWKAESTLSTPNGFESTALLDGE